MLLMQGHVLLKINGTKLSTTASIPTTFTVFANNSKKNIFARLDLMSGYCRIIQYSNLDNATVILDEIGMNIDILYLLDPNSDACNTWAISMSAHSTAFNKCVIIKSANPQTQAGKSTAGFFVYNSLTPPNAILSITSLSVFIIRAGTTVNSPYTSFN